MARHTLARSRSHRNDLPSLVGLLFLIGFSFASVRGTAWAGNLAATAPQPNIIFILADDK